MALISTIAAIVFICTYLFIAVNKTPWFEIKRSHIALIGASLMIIVGAISFTDAIDSVNMDVIMLLLGMMLLVAGLEYTGFFTLLSNLMVKQSSSKRKMLAIVMLISAILSAVALNDAAVLILTPIVIRCCQKADADPIPFLVGLMMSANIGSISTAVGNPQNAYVLSVSGMDFITFSLYSIPISIVCILLTYAILLLIFRKSLYSKYEYHIDVHENERPVAKKQMYLMITVMICTFVGFLCSGIGGYRICVVSMVSGAISLLIIASSEPRYTIWAIKHVDWHVLLFFIGLFVLIGGASNTGLISDLSSSFPGFREGDSLSITSLSIFTVVLSNIVSNVPAVMLITEMITDPTTMMLIALAASSTLAGNTTLIGSVANIIVAERSENYGIRIDFFKFMLVGIVVTVVTIAAMILMINLMFN